MNAASIKSGPTGPRPAASEAVGTGRERFVRAARCQEVDRPPVWLMRQAGRAIPEYRALKEKHSFLELVQTPELAAEVTLQPIRRFGFDAAILFSDILVVPEAMGQAYRFPETGGVVMDFAVRGAEDVARLSVEGVTERLSYVDAALRLIRRELGERTALIGFAGSPWTLASFMMEGGSAASYTRALKLFREDRKTFYALAEKLTAAVGAYLGMQRDAGVDALQLFDSHGGHLRPDEFEEASGRWLREIIAMLRGAGAASRAKPGGHPGWTPGRSGPAVIVFSFGTHGSWDSLLATGADVVGIDWQFSLSKAREILPATVALQGNLTPALLSEGTAAEVAGEAGRLLMEMRGRAGYIFNAGHGVPPGAKLENIAAVVETVRNWKKP